MHDAVAFDYSLSSFYYYRFNWVVVDISRRSLNDDGWGATISKITISLVMRKEEFIAIWSLVGGEIVAPGHRELDSV